MANSKVINQLKQSKIIKEVDLIKFREQSNDILKNITQTKAQLTQTKLAYQQASDSGLSDRQRELSEAMQKIQALLGSLDKQKKDIDHVALEYNEELVKLNTEIAHQESTNTSSYFSSSKQKATDVTSNVQQTEEEAIAETETTTVTPATQNTSQPQKLTQKSIKKQLKANLASGQPKKNLTLIRQGMGQKPISQPIATPIASTLQQTNLTQAQKRSIWKKVLNYGKQQVKNAAYDAYDTAKRPVVRTVKTITKPYYVAKNATETTSAIISATKEHGPRKVVAFGAQEAGTAIKNRALGGVTKVLSPAINLANNIKNIVKTVKNIIKAIRIATSSATLVGAVVNIALLFKDKLKKILKVVAKIIAGIQALMLLMWLWLLAKIAGILAGLAFGLISGIPLLFIPVIGPALYAGWVSFWTYKGWTDPLGTIHIATHPWELVTRPLNWIGDQFSGFAGGAKGGVDAVAGGVGNLTGGAANFVTGLASTGWGAASGLVTGFVSTTSSIVGSIWGGLAGASSAVAGNIAAVAVAGGVGTALTATVFGAFSINSSLYTPALDPTEAPSEFPPGENELFTVTKTAQPQAFANVRQLDAQVTFTITITPKNQNITNIALIDNLRFRQGTQPEQSLSPPPSTSFECINLPLTATKPCTITFNQSVSLIPDDSIITNTIYAETILADGSKQTATATVTVLIGAAVGNCPTSWPITGEVTQGPEGATSHANNVFGGYEALDIGAETGTDVYSTVSGTIEYVDDSRGSPDIRLGVKPTGCNNPDLKLVHFWHLFSAGFEQGQIINKGEIIGLSGHVAPHLHYQFNGEPNLATGDRSFRMETPNIPVTVTPRDCQAACNIQTTAP